MHEWPQCVRGYERAVSDRKIYAYIFSLHSWAFSGPQRSNDEYEYEIKSLTCEAKQGSKKCIENAVIDSRLQRQQLFLCRIYLLQ